MKKMTPLLPKLATLENENERLVDQYNKPMILNFEKKRRQLRSYTNNPSPEPREISLQEKLQSEPWKNLYTTRLETKNDNFEQFEWNTRRFSQDNADEIIKDYEAPMILRTQSSGLELQELYRTKTPIRIISTNRGTSVGRDLRMPRSITTETPLPTQSTALDTECRNDYLHTDRPSQAYRSPFIKEILNPLIGENRIRAPKKKSLSPLQVYPRNTKLQQDEGMRLKTAVLDSVPLSKLVNENCGPLDVLLERERYVLDQFGNNPTISGEKQKRHKRTSSMELQSARLPTQELQTNLIGGRLQRVQRVYTEVTNRNIIHVEDDNMRRELSKSNKVLTARLRPKFRGQEAILNKLFNQHSSTKK